MKITKELLKSWGACEEGFAWFISKNFDSDPDYSAVHAELVNDKEYGYAEWLSNRAFSLMVSSPSEIDVFVESVVAFTISESSSSENASSGHGSTAASSGDGSKAASSGDYSTAASSGHGSKAASSGNYSTAASSGDGSKAASSGDYSTAASSGDYSTAASSGDYSTAASSGDYSTAASSGHGSKAASSGDYSKAASSGTSTVAMVAGLNGMAKVGENGAFALAFKDGEQMRIAVGIVGEEGIKANTFYKVSNGVLVEAEA